jgi:outer membrane lipoprotein-sorting protein
MKKMLTFILAGLFLAASITVPGSAQTTEQIVKKMIEAQGGKKVLESIKDMTMTGTIELVMQGMTASFTIYKKEPDKRRLDAEVMGMVITQAYDGETGWGTNFQTGGIEDMNEEQTVEARREAMAIVSILYPEKFGMSFAYKGKETLDDKEYFVMEQTYPDGLVVTLHVDAKTYLVYKSKANIMGPMGVEVEAAQINSDYKKVNGLMIAHSIVAFSDGEESQKITVEKVSFNTGLEDSLFKKE